jgi:hypothetical protein
MVRIRWTEDSWRGQQLRWMRYATPSSARNRLRSSTKLRQKWASSTTMIQGCCSRIASASLSGELSTANKHLPWLARCWCR